VVPPSERGTVAIREGHVVVIVVIGSSPEWEDVSERPREVVSRMSVNCLTESESDPKVDGEDMEILSEKAVKEGTGDGTLGKDKDFKWVGVLGS
jgi:hypothetical protein